jgi:hypothetical protein
VQGIQPLFAVAKCFEQKRAAERTQLYGGTGGESQPEPVAAESADAHLRFRCPQVEVAQQQAREFQAERIRACRKRPLQAERAGQLVRSKPAVEPAQIADLQAECHGGGIRQRAQLHRRRGSRSNVLLLRPEPVLGGCRHRLQQVWQLAQPPLSRKLYRCWRPGHLHKAHRCRRSADADRQLKGQQCPLGVLQLGELCLQEALQAVRMRSTSGELEARAEPLRERRILQHGSQGKVDEFGVEAVTRLFGRAQVCPAVGADLGGILVQDRLQPEGVYG